MRQNSSRYNRPQPYIILLVVAFALGVFYVLFSGKGGEVIGDLEGDDLGSRADQLLRGEETSLEQKQYFIKNEDEHADEFMPEITSNHGQIKKNNYFEVDDANWLDVYEEKKNEDEDECHHFHAKPGGPKYPQVLKKTQFSNTTKFVFVVGLEGSGHHLFKPLLTNPDFKCEACRCPLHVPGFSVVSDRSDGGMFGTDTDRRGLQKYVKRFQTYFNHRPRLSRRPTTYFINTLCGSWTTGEVSYPNFGGNCRSIKFADARLLAELFESTGQDFRVLIVIRNAVDILLSTTVHRHFSNVNYTEIMLNDIIRDQISRLDSSFIRCIDYDELPKVDDDLGKFLGTDTVSDNGDNSFRLSREMKRFYTQSESNEEREREERNYIINDTKMRHVYLQRAIDKLKEFCRR